MVLLSVRNNYKRRIGTKFITTNLQSGDEIKYRAKIHIFLQPAIILGIGFLCYFESNSIIHYLGVTILFSGLGSILQRVFVKVGSIYAVTNQRVIIKTGVISRRTTELVLAKCEGVQIVRGVLGRIFGYGSIVVFNGSATNCYYFVVNPFRFKQVINMRIALSQMYKTDLDNLLKNI